MMLRYECKRLVNKKSWFMMMYSLAAEKLLQDLAFILLL